MSTAILRIPTPESCRLCPIVRIIKCREGDDILDENAPYVQCPFLRATWDDNVLYKNRRPPDCPLEITEDNLRWIEDPDTFSEKLICPKCKGVHDYCSIFYDNYKYCPNCGVRLLHPKEWEK